VLGMSHFLGFRFAPQIAAPLDRHLWTIGWPAGYGPLNALLKGRVSTRLIVDHWEELKRLADSIQDGVTPSSVPTRKLASYPGKTNWPKPSPKLARLSKPCICSNAIGMKPPGAGSSGAWTAMRA
jgi:TnpA family transposase